MTNATLEAVKAAIKERIEPDAFEKSLGIEAGVTLTETELTYIAQAAIDAMPGWRPVSMSDVVDSGVRQAVRLRRLDVIWLQDEVGVFILEFTPEQMRDIYNAVGMAINNPPPGEGE